MLTDYPPEVADTIEDMMMKLEPIVPPVRETEESDSVQCRRHLMGAMIAGGPRTEPKRVGELLCEVVEQVWPTADTGQLSIDRKEEKKKALKLNDTHKLLNRHGVRLFVDEQNRVDDETGGTVVELIPVVAVANDHQGLNTIFERFRWAGGTWAQSLKRLPGATFKEPGKSKGRPIQIGGVKARATFLPWDALELDDDDDDSDDG